MRFRNYFPARQEDRFTQFLWSRSRRTNYTGEVKSHPAPEVIPIVQFLASNQRWWLSLVAAISVCLWAANWLPIQRVEYKLTTNIAISQHRLPILQGLEGKSLVSESCSGFSFVIDDVQCAAFEAGAAVNSDLASARVTMVFNTRSRAGQLEMLLDQLTKPQAQSEECRQITKQIQKERWILETALHSKKLYELDLKREKESREVSTDQVADTVDSSDSKLVSKTPGTRFQLSSFVSQRSHRLGVDDLAQQLETAIVKQSQKIQALEISIDRLKAQTQGYLNFTGSPSVAPVAHAIPPVRLFVLASICFAIWFLLSWWTGPWGLHGGQATRIGKRISFHRWITVLVANNQALRARPASKSSSRNNSHAGSVKKQRFEMAGIPFLGTVQVNVCKQIIQEVPAVSFKIAEKMSEPTLLAPSQSHSFNALQLLRRLGEGSLVLWFAVLVARLMLDPAWRELVCVAPLAALARLVTGIK